MTQEEAITRFKAAHGEKYDYSFVEYRSKDVKVAIGCAEHGVFHQRPASHWKGYGCRACSQRRSVTDLMARITAVHGNRFTYPNFEVVTTRSFITVRCSVHGDFTQRLSSHLEGYGCKGCAKLSDSDGVIARFKEVHGGRYDYSEVRYVGTHTKVKIKCPTHGVFEQAPMSHFKGIGCSACGEYGIDYSAPATLYYLKINDGQAYKIGITGRTVADRFAGEAAKIEVIKEKQFPTGAAAKRVESRILRRFRRYQWSDAPLLSSGNTEMFVRDIRRDAA